MTITPETPAKTLTQMVATEIRVQMARHDVRQSQLARQIGKTEQWLSVRLRGRQPIDLNDLALIASGIGVGVHDLLPRPEEAAEAVYRPIPRYLAVAERPAFRDRPDDNRPVSRETVSAGAGPGRTAYLDRGKRSRRDR